MHVPWFGGRRRHRRLPPASPAPASRLPPPARSAVRWPQPEPRVTHGAARVTAPSLRSVYPRDISLTAPRR